ncbi:hypothetical protein D3C80_939710 [compost metagenome]
MGDRRVTEQTLEVALGQCQQVTDQDRGNGNHRQHGGQHAAAGSRRKHVQTHDNGEHRDLAGGGQEGGDRCRSTFVDVRGPQVERHQRQFERQTHQHHAQAQLCQQAWHVGSGQRLTDTVEAQATGIGVEQGHTEQQERRTGSRQHHVLDAGFQRTLVEEGISDQAVDRYREQLQANEQASQVLRADQYQAAQGSHQDQQVQFFAVARVAFAAVTQVGMGEGYTGQGGDQDQRHVQAGELVDGQQRSDRQWHDFEYRQDRQQGQVQAHDRQQEGLRVVAAPGDCQHHHDNGDGGNQQRRKRDKVLNRQVHSALTGPKRVE